MFFKKKKRKKGYLVIQRGIGVTPFPTITGMVAPMKIVKFAKSRNEAKKIRRQMRKRRLMEKPLSTQVKKSYGYGKNTDLFLESFRFENVLTGKRWRKKK